MVACKSCTWTLSITALNPNSSVCEWPPPSDNNKILNKERGVRCDSGGYVFDKDAEVKLQRALQARHAAKGEHFGNGRMVRNLYEATLRCHANRVAAIPKMTRELLITITGALVYCAR